MTRVVLDTNLLVSYLITHRPAIATLIDDHLLRQHFILVTAPELLAELDRVLAYPKLQRYYSEQDRTQFVALIMAVSEVVDLPEAIPRIGRDPDDDRVIACAVAGAADCRIGRADQKTSCAGGRLPGVWVRGRSRGGCDAGRGRPAARPHRWGRGTPDPLRPRPRGRCTTCGRRRSRRRR